MPVTISIIVPVKNEEAAIGAFLVRVPAVLDNLPAREGEKCNWEILFIDDGSEDETLAKIYSAHLVDRRVRAISLSRNFGKEAALSAGLDYAAGAAVIPLDVDLQDPPEVIAEMVARWAQGYEVVYGIRRRRDADSLPKRLTAHIYYRLHNWISGNKIPEHAGDFRLLDRKVVDAIKLMPERNRLMKGLFAWSGFRQIGVEYTRAPRELGETKFNYWRLWTLGIDGITSASTLPLRVWSYVGALIASFALFYAVFLVVRTWLYGPDVAGYPSMMVGILFLGGVQLISLGVLGEYVGRIMIEVKQRPLYIVRERIGGE